MFSKMTVATHLGCNIIIILDIAVVGGSPAEHDTAGCISVPIMAYSLDKIIKPPQPVTGIYTTAELSVNLI